MKPLDVVTVKGSKVRDRLVGSSSTCCKKATLFGVMLVKDGSMYDRCMMKEGGQWCKKDICWRKSRAFNDHLMMLTKNDGNVG
jgi:hypothetical protein